MERFIGKAYKEYQSKCIENLQYGKQIDDFLDIPKRQKTSTGPKTHVLGLEYDKSGNQVPNFGNFETYEKMFTEILCRMAVTLFQTSS